MAVSRKHKLDAKDHKTNVASKHNPAQAESEVRPNQHKPKVAFSKDLPDGKIPYA